MAMNGNNLGDEIRAQVDTDLAAVADPTDIDAVRQAMFRAMGKAIVAHITTNGVISVSTTVASGIAVAVTPATGFGATTATGTGTDTAGTIA